MFTSTLWIPAFVGMTGVVFDFEKLKTEIEN